MQITREDVAVPVARDASRSVDGVVRVRGIDATVAGRGAIIQWREPHAVVVRDGDRVTRLAVPATDRAGMLVAFVLAPVASYLLSKAFSGKRR
jgi:hypothetical protein